MFLYRYLFLPRPLCCTQASVCYRNNKLDFVGSCILPVDCINTKMRSVCPRLFKQRICDNLKKNYFLPREDTPVT